MNETVIRKKHRGYRHKIIKKIIIIILLLSISIPLLNSVLRIENKQQIKYVELGNLDYKIYLKDNEFYEKEYLDENMEYISSLIKNIDIDIVYELEAEGKIQTEYKVLGNLLIYNESGNNVLYEKEYLIKEKELGTENIEGKIQIDYDYYNNIANSFKYTYGVDAESKLEVRVLINKKISEVDNGLSEMVLTIPLTKKTLKIKLDNKTINKNGMIEKEIPLTKENKINIISLIIITIIILIQLVKIIKILFLLKPTETQYDKSLKKILTEYDRMIIETKTEPNFEEKNIIRIEKFEELLDVRDNLKNPIIYYSVQEHHKAHFYIEQNTNCYLYILSSSDIEEK